MVSVSQYCPVCGEIAHGGVCYNCSWVEPKPKPPSPPRPSTKPKPNKRKRLEPPQQKKKKKSPRIGILLVLALLGFVVFQNDSDDSSSPSVTNDSVDEEMITLPNGAGIVPANAVDSEELSDGSIFYYSAGIKGMRVIGTTDRLTDYPLFGVVSAPHSMTVISVPPETSNIDQIEHFIYSEEAHWLVGVLKSGELLDVGERVPAVMHQAFLQSETLVVGNSDAPPFRLLKSGSSAPVDRWVIGVVYSPTSVSMGAGEIRQAMLVDEVIPGGPAERAGIRPQDIILSAERTAVLDAVDLSTIIKPEADRATPVAIDLLRGTSIITVSLVPVLLETDVK